MKKNIVTFLLGLSVLFVGSFVVNAEALRQSAISVKFAKNSAGDVETRLAKINSIVKKGQAMRNQMCMDCLDSLEFLEGVAQAATDACGGPSGSNYNSASCQSWLSYADRVGDAFMASGCGWILGYIDKNNREISMPNIKTLIIIKEVFTTG